MSNEEQKVNKSEEPEKPQKVDVVLIGPQAAGKTTIYSILKGKSIPDDHYATQGQPPENRSPRTRGLWDRMFKKNMWFLDLGGGEFDRFEKWIKDNDVEYVIIVFNGVELLKEMDEPEKGGRTTSYCKMILSKMKGKEGVKVKLVATHKDIFDESMKDEFDGSMKDEILRKIQKVNGEYKSFFATKRYPFDMEGRLFEVKAKEKDSVIAVFKEILK